VSVSTQLRFTDDKSAAIEAVDSIASGRGWCNVVAQVVGDEQDLKVNVFGLWANRGVAVASLVTAPFRDGTAQPSTLGVLHTRGRLGMERIGALIGGASFAVQQDHRQRGLLLSVPPATPSAQVLDVMCTMATSLCDYEVTGSWRLDLFVRTKA
jgi:hypothetical protein